MKEVWKTITFADKYEVSNLGRIRNKTTKRELKTKQTPSHRHPQVRLCVGHDLRYQLTVSQIVYNHFSIKEKETPSYYSYNRYMVKGNRIGHKDGNPLNNTYNNLFRY